MKPRLTQEQKDEIGRLYSGGLTILQVAARTGVAHGTVQQALARAGVPRRPRGAQPGPVTWDAAEIRRLYSGGLSVRAVAAKTGTTRHRVHQVVTEAGIARPEGSPAREGQPAGTARPVTAHEAAPVPGTEWSFLGQPAELGNEFHYPVEAQCPGCDDRVILAAPAGTWVHAREYYGTTS